MLQWFLMVVGGSKYQSHYLVVLPATQLDRSDPPSPHGTLEEHADTTMLFESFWRKMLTLRCFS